MNRDLTVTIQPPTAGLKNYLRYRRVYSAALLGTLVLLTAMTRIATQIVDVGHWGIAVQTWELIVWETSSAIVILALVPLMLIFVRYVPLTWINWRRALPKHVLASAVFSIIHVEAMLILRKLAYAVAGRTYGFDDWIGQWIYEYVKDIRTYFTLLFLIYVYRFILLRLQGEASELATPEAATPEPCKYPDRFLVRKLDREFLVAVQEVEWLEAQGNYINLHVRGYAYPLRSTMAAMETRLDPAKFVRVHRSYIVNVDYLAEIQPQESGDARLKLRDGTQVQCSRTYRAALKERTN